MEVGGKSVPGNVAAISGTAAFGTANLTLLSIGFLQTSYTCDQIKQAEANNTSYKNTQSFSVSVSSSAGAIQPGTYMVPDSTSTGGMSPTTTASASYNDYDAMCKNTSTDATKGTVTISSVSDSNVSGTYDVTFMSGDHVTGSFNTAVCNVGMLKFTSDTNPTNCM